MAPCFPPFEARGRRRLAALPGHQRAPLAAAENRDWPYSHPPANRRGDRSALGGTHRPSPPSAQPSRTETAPQHHEQDQSRHRALCAPGLMFLKGLRYQSPLKATEVGAEDPAELWQRFAKAGPEAPAVTGVRRDGGTNLCLQRWEEHAWKPPG